jgi:hypothetical protein
VYAVASGETFVATMLGSTVLFDPAIKAPRAMFRAKTLVLTEMEAFWDAGRSFQEKV